MHSAHLNKLLDYIETGVKEGATLVYGGRRLSRKGTWVNDDDSFYARRVMLPYRLLPGAGSLH